MARYKDKEAKYIAAEISKSKTIVDSIRGLDENEKISAFQAVLEHFLKSKSVSPEESSVGSPFVKEGKLQFTSSFAGFIKKLKAKSQADKALAATYCCFKSGKKSVTSKDILDKYKEALLKKSKNMNAEINSNISKGYMMPLEKIGSRKAYSITSDGIEYLETKLKKGSDKDD